ncbi:hypothetical protein ACWENA_22575 [Streptomyces sp. NPDC004779]
MGSLPVSGRYGRADGEARLLVTSEGETDYAVVGCAGEKGGDGVSKAGSTTQLTVFPAGCTGTVESGRTFGLPYKPGTFAAQDREGIVHSRASMAGKNTRPVTLNTATGAQTI